MKQLQLAYLNIPLIHKSNLGESSDIQYQQLGSSDTPAREALTLPPLGIGW